MSRVFIGLPTYNGAAHLREALDSICQQTYQDWQLLISDNGSQDETAEICKDYTSRDARIHYHRQPDNVGAWNNFKFVLDQADSPYFAWFPDDYVMEAGFLEVCASMLDADPDIGLAMSNIAYRDSTGRNVLLNSEASKIVQNGDRGRPLVYSYLLAKEMAVFIYGLYRRELLQEAVAPYYHKPLTNAFDCYVVLRVLSRSGLAVDAGFRQIIPYEDTWYQRTFTYDYLGFGTGFGLRFLWESVRALPWKWKAGGLLILAVRWQIGVAYKVLYMQMIHGPRGLVRKLRSIFRAFGRRYVTRTDQRLRR